MSQFTLYHNNNNLKTLSDFMEANRIIGISVDDLFDYKYNDTKSNRDLFFEQMSTEEKALYSKELGKTKDDPAITASDLKSDMTLPCPCIFKIDSKYLVREIAISQTNFQASTDDIYAFENSHIQNILSNEGYNIQRYAKKVAPSCSVWGWFKSLYYSGSTFFGDHYQSKNNKFVNISDFIIDVNTNVTAQGGTFSITLPIIHSVGKSETKLVTGGSKFLIDGYTDRFASQAELFIYNRYASRENRKNFFHKVGISSMDDNYFNWLIQSNDLIFISFEELELESESGSKVFDMIGLVENVSVNVDASGRGSVSVSGKDLMKLITDDNSLFFNTSSASGESRIFSNTESAGKQGDIRDADMIGGSENSPENRLRLSTNQIDVFALPFNRSIDFVIKGVISQLANIEVVPDYVFTSWGDARTKFRDFLSYQEVEETAPAGAEYESENLNNSEFVTGIEFNRNRGKDWTIDGGKSAKSLIDEGTTPGSARSLNGLSEIRLGGDPRINDGLILPDGYIIAR